MLQHDGVYLMDRVYMDCQGGAVHLQVPLGESDIYH